MTHELDPDLQKLVNLTRKARTPGEADKLRIAQRLALPLAAGAAAGTAAGTAKAVGGFSNVLFKVAAVVALGAAAAGVVVSQREPSPAPSQRVPSAAAPQVPPASKASSEPLDTRPSIDPLELPLQPKIQKPNPTGMQSGRPANELAEEAALLHEAQTAWRAGQSARALGLANQHAQRFPRSQLANERDVLRVLSLCKLGQVKAAKAVSARLLSKAKGSPWYQSVAQSCAAD